MDMQCSAYAFDRRWELSFFLGSPQLDSGVVAHRQAKKLERLASESSWDGKGKKMFPLQPEHLRSLCCGASSQRW